MSERTAEAATTVDEDGIRVEKSFTDDAFPVPAVMYTLSSHREDPVRVRIVDRIPESFPMDRVGFHPEYESENWTAYKDHRVEFERVIDPDESVETVFGIRDDDPDLDGFLGTPVIEHVPVGEEIEDVLGAGDTDAVREVLSGDRTTLPGMTEDDELLPEDSAEEPAKTPDTEEADPEPAEAAAADTEPETEVEEPKPDAPEPRAVDEGTAAVTAHEGDSVGTATEAEPEAEPTADDGEPDETPEIDEAGAVEPLDDVRQSAVDEDTESDEGDETVTLPGEGGLAAALAAEIRSGAADEEDVETIGEALGGGVPRSVDVRIARLQSSVADIEAYADALAEFIDGEGTAREILDGIDERVDEVESEVDALDDRLDAADDEREAIASDVDRVDSAVDSTSEAVDAVDERVDAVEDDVGSVEGDVRAVEADVRAVEDEVASVDEAVESVRDAVSTVETDVDDLGDDVETLYEEVDRAAERAESAEERAESAEDRAAAAAERVDDVESGLDRFDEEFDDLWDDLAEVDTRLTDVEDRLGEDLDDVAAEIEEINDHLDELDEFRTRLNEAFGP